MSVWACNEKHRLVRIISPRNSEESIVSQVSQDNILPQMDNPENQQGLYEPTQHGGNATLPINPVLEGGNGNLQQNQYRTHPAPLPNIERTLREILQPQRTTTNSCIRLPDEANQFLMKSEMIRLLPVYQGFESENPYSFMRDFEDVCSAFLSTGSPLHIICLVLFPFALKEKAKIWFYSLAPNSIFTWENMRNEFLNTLLHVPIPSCEQFRTFLKSQVNPSQRYGKDIRISSMLSLIMGWTLDKFLHTFIKDCL